MGSVLNIEDEYGDGLDITEFEGVVEIEVSDTVSTTFYATPEQAEQIERTLYKIRVARPFNDRKEPDADGEPGPGPELEGRASPPAGA